MTALALAAAAPAAAQDYSNSYTFIKAIKDRNGAKVESLLAAPGSTVSGAKEQGTGNGALHIVTLDRDVNWLGFLIGKGMKVDARNSQGNSALSLAAQLGWVEGAQLLLRYSAAVDHANNRGETPLILAVQNRDLAMVRLLLARGADPKRTDSVAGYSALDYARQDSRAATIARTLEEAATKPARPLQGPKL
jgi:ankyrin repeat protein